MGHIASFFRLRSSLNAVLLVLVFLGMTSLAPAMAQTPPTVGEIVGDSYDCDTGELNFHVSVENVPHVPEGTSGFDYPLFYSYTAYYSNGTDYFPSRQAVWSPPADQDPYTGTVYLTATVPPENIYGEPGTGVITSIDLYVGVGQYDEVTDSATATYVVDCTSVVPPPEVPTYTELIAQLVALLIAILTTLFG